MPKFGELPHLKSHLVLGSLSDAKCGKGKFMENRYSLKFRFVEFPASKSLFFALMSRSALVATLLRNVESVGS